MRLLMSWRFLQSDCVEDSIVSHGFGKGSTHMGRHHLKNICHSDNNKCTGPLGKKKCKLHILCSVCVMPRLLCVCVCVVICTLFLIEDNWHFKGIALDRETWTNKYSRQNDMRNENDLYLLDLTYTCYYVMSKINSIWIPMYVNI